MWDRHRGTAPRLDHLTPGTKRPFPDHPSPKLAITVDPEVHARIVAAAAEEGVSVSAWMTEAVRRTLLVRDGLSAVAEWELSTAR